MLSCPPKHLHTVRRQRLGLNRAHPRPFDRQFAWVTAFDGRVSSRQTCTAKSRCTSQPRRARGHDAAQGGPRRGRGSLWRALVRTAPRGSLAHGSLNAIFGMTAAPHVDSSTRRSRNHGISSSSPNTGVVKLVMSPLLGSAACSPYVPTIGVACPNGFGVSLSMCPRFWGQGAPTIGDGVLLFLATVLRGPLSLNFDPAQFKNSRVGDWPR